MMYRFKFLIPLFILTAVLLVSCQSEESRTVANPDALDKNSELTQLLKRVAMNDTSSDNVIDSTSCYSVKLPVDVVVNNTAITISTADDYVTVKSIFQQSSADVDELDFVFPITLVNAAYEEISIASELQLNGLIDVCANTIGESIDCMSINYPLTVYSYNPDFQIESTDVFDNDAEFFLFLYNLEENEFYAIDYPIATFNSAGDPINYESAASFYEGINAAIEECECSNPEILTNDLIMYIPFGGESVDLTGNSAVNVLGNVGYVTDRSGNPSGAMSFLTGDESNLINASGGAQSDFLQSGKFTISMWFNRQDASPQNPFEQLMTTESLSLRLGSSNNNGQVFGPVVINNGSPETMYDNDWVTNGLLGNIGQWHHVVITYDGTFLMLYRDGVIRNASAEAGLGTSIPGADWGGNFKGFIDDIRVYKRALTQQEVQILYNMAGDVNTCLN